MRRLLPISYLIILLSILALLSGCLPLTSPKNLAASAGDGVVVLTWNPVASAVSYNVYFSTVEGTAAEGVVIRDINDSSFVHAGLTNSTTYYYVVRAVGDDGTESDPSNEVSATPQQPTLTAPQNVRVVYNNTDISLSWNGVAGASSYTIIWSLNQNMSNPTPISGLQQLSHTFAVPHFGSPIYIAVFAVGSGGDQGVRSNAVSIAFTWRVDNSDEAKLASHGGGGGNAFSYRCPNGHVLTHVTGRSGARLDAVRLGCSELRSNGSLGTNIRWSGTFGGGGGNAFSASCPQGRMVTSLFGRAGNRVDRLGFECLTLAAMLEGNYQARSLMGPFGGGGGNEFLSRCPVGFAITGMEGRAGVNVDQARAICSPIKFDVAL